MLATRLLAVLLLSLPGAALARDVSDAEAILHIEAQRLPPTALQHFVASDAPQTRARAAQALGRLRTADAIPDLRTLAADGSSRVRTEAVYALGQTPDSERALLTVLRHEDDPAIRALILEGLGKQADVAGLRVLLDALHQEVGFLETPHEARAAAIGLGHIALRNRDALTRPDIISNLTSQLRRFDVETRRAAGFALARIRPERVAPKTARLILERAASEPDAVTQAFLVRATASLRGVDAERSATYTQTSRDPAPGVRIATARAAATSGWTGVAAMLADRDIGVRHQAIEAIGSVEALDRAAVLIPIVATGDSIEAAEDLMLDQDPRMLDAVVALRTLARHDLLTDPTPWLQTNRPTPIRAAAVHAVVDQALLVRLALDDAEAPVRSGAVLRLSELEPELDNLIPLLAATDAMVAAIAAEAIAAAPESGAEDALIEAVSTAIDADLLAQGLGALAALYEGSKPIVSRVDSTAVTAARTHLEHRHTRVRDASLRILAAANQKASSGSGHTSELPFADLMAVTSARIQTDRGEFIIDLDPDQAPLTVWNFVTLADQGWYDGVSWHRVVPDFVAQTGDRRGDGTGGPAWTIPDEINRMAYRTGVVGMAHAGPETAGSQWFITLSPQPHLNGSYTAFGTVTHGMGVVKQLQPSDRIRRVRIERLSDR